MEVSLQDSIIWKFVTDLKLIKNETARKERFIVLLCELFPSHRDSIGRFAGGAESYLRVEAANGSNATRGFVDTLFGNLVIEFEHKLPKMLSIAEGQLRGYVAQLWSNRENYVPYLCIATDGVVWHLYSPRIKLPSVTSSILSSDNIELVENEVFSLEDIKNIPLFKNWIDRILFRENSIRPEGKIIANEYGQRGHVFVRSIARLELVLHYVNQTPQFKVAFENWGRYLRYTYGELNAKPDLFLRHSYMSAFAKLLVASMFAKKLGKKVSAENIQTIVSGDFFADLKVQNYCEKDFFGWLNNQAVALELNDLWFSIFNSLAIYDFTETSNDFLKDIYQELVDPEDRHDLGEYYTPDWLCEKLVSHMLNSQTGDFKIADITCGSGSFLRAAISHIKSNMAADWLKEDTLGKITSSVVGFEIHPLAVFIAKTNYLIAVNELILKSSRPISIPVYLCDSLLTPQENEDLFTVNSIRFKIGDVTIVIPRSISANPHLLVDFIDYCENIAELIAVSKSTGASEIDEPKIRSFFKKRNFVCGPIEIDAAINLINVLSIKKKKNEDTIWAYVLKNNLQPYLFKNFFDVIVGNPPWLSFRYVSDESYRKEIEWLGMEKYRVAPQSSSLRTQMELATIFLAHACSYYLKPKGHVGFVMPRSIFSADHHAPFREERPDSVIKIEEIWDLMEVRPLFNVPTCVVIAGSNETASARIVPDTQIEGESNGGRKEEIKGASKKTGKANARKKAS